MWNKKDEHGIEIVGIYPLQPENSKDVDVYIWYSNNHLLFERNRRIYRYPKRMQICYYPIAWGDFRLPVDYFLNQRTVIYEEYNDFLKPAKEKTSVPVFFLIDSKAVSFAETIIEIIKKNRLGILVGQPTTGTNGDVENVHLNV